MQPSPLVQPFPLPTSDLIREAYWDLFLSEHGTEADKDRVGEVALLPRPWDIATCTDPRLRACVWDWYAAVVTWFNSEYAWDPAHGMIPPCWPLHPHLVHDIGVLADQRRRAGMAVNSNALEEWHRYGVPAFLDRLRGRIKQHCDTEHQPNPARSRHARHQSPDAASLRDQAIGADLSLFGPPDPAPVWPGLRLVDDSGRIIDPRTGEVL